MNTHDVKKDDLLHKLPRTEEGLPRAGNVIIQERLGKGGMGAVYLGRDTKLNVPVAVKVVPFHLIASNPDLVKRFQREAQTAAQIDHPNLMRVYTVDEDRGVHYLVLEFVDGESAAERLKREGPLPEADALEIAVAAGEALSAAHAEGIIHRDIKPANIMIRYKDGRVKVADLGLAKSFHEETSRDGGLTATGQMLGTPAYMSPEQANDASHVDPRTDVYSLGATLYALLTGHAPHEATQLLKLLMKVTNEEPEELGRLRPELNDATCDAVRRMMAKRPMDRIATMAGAVAAMDEARKALSVSSKGLARPQLAGGRMPSASAAAEVGRTLTDVTPDELAEPPTVQAARRATARAPSGGAGKKIAIALGVLAAVGVVGAVFYPRKQSEEHDRDVASLVATAQSLRESGLLDKASDKLAEVLAIQPDHAGAKRLLGEVRAEIAASEADAERAAAYKKWMDKALELKIGGRLEGAAQAYATAAGHAPAGSEEATKAAGECHFEHYGPMAKDAVTRGDLKAAVQFYVKALENKEDPAARKALNEAAKTLYTRQAKTAVEQGDFRAAAGFYGQAAKYGDEVAARIAANERAYEEAEKRFEVSRRGGGQYATIAGAIRAAEPDSVILVRPGVYGEGLVIDKPLHVLGGGPAEEIVIDSTEADCVYMKADRAVVRGLTLRCRAGTKDLQYFGVDIERGRLVLEDCDVTSDSLACVAIHGAKTDPILRKCRIHDGKAGGVFVYEGARGTVEDCDIYGNTLAGIEIRGADTVVRNCRVYDGKASGVFVCESARGTVEDCDVYGNAAAGMEITEEADPVVRMCRIRDGKQSGVLIDDKAKGTLEDVEIFGNTLAGLEVARGADPVVRNCRLHDGKAGGVFVYEDGKGTFENCDIFGNALAGMEVSEGADPVARKCKIRDGKGGVFVHTDGKGRFEDCDIVGNVVAGVEVEGGNPVLQGCRINRNGYEAVWVHDNGAATIEDCDLTGNARGAWDIEAGCEVKRSRNKE